MNWKNVSLTLVVASALLLASMLVAMPAEEQATQKGPRAPGLDINFYTSNEQAFAALLVGEIEYMGMLTKAQFDTAKTRPEIITYPEITYTMIDEALMSNYTCITDQASYPGVRNPMNNIQFRKAVMHLADKAYWMSVIYEGFAERIDVPIAAPSRDWWNPGVTGDNYPYPFSVSDAIAHLEGGTCSKHGYIAPADSAGFIDHDGNGIRNYPVGWPGAPIDPNTGKPVDMLPLQYWIYNAPAEREACARNLGGYLEDIGIPVSYRVASYDVVMEQCWCLYDYHIATDGWGGGKSGVGRFPTYLFSLFHSSMWMPEWCGSNAYTGGDDEPWAAEVDAAIEGIKFTSDYWAALSNALDAQYLIIDKYALMLPYMSEKGYMGYRNLIGGSKFYGRSFMNDYTLMKAQRADNPAANIRIGTDMAPPSMNTIHAMWSASYLVMGMSWWTPDPIMLNPIDPMIEHPGKIRDWETTTWVDPTDGQTKTRVTHWLTKEASWIEPVTGNVLDPLTTAEYEFGAWYMYQTPEAWLHADYRNIHHIRLDATDTSKFEISFDKQGWHFFFDALSTNFGMYAVHEGEGFKQSPIATKETRVFVEGVNATTPGDLPLPRRTIGAPVEIVSIRQNGVPLTRSTIGSDNDYEIVNGRIHIYKDIPDGASIEVTYWARGDATGYTAGGLPWQEVMTGTGAWYMTYFDRITGASFEANRNHQLETPPLGETDWYWEWIEGPKPRDGYMIVDEYDVTFVLDCFESQGRYIPDPHWNPTADVAPEVGIINIYDAGTTITEYSAGIKFWSPLPNPPPLMGTDKKFNPQSLSSSESFPTTGPSVFVDPPSITVYEGNNFTISVKIFNLTDAYISDPVIPWRRRQIGNLYGLGLNLLWAPPILDHISHEVTAPVEDYPNGVLHEPVWIYDDSVDAIAGTYKLAVSSYFPASGFNNPGQSNTIFNMTFEAKKGGSSDLTLAITKFATQRYGPGAGRINHHKFSGSVRVKMRGDVNGDNNVNSLDLIEFYKAYGSILGSSNWNAECDFNKDNKIDVHDLFDLSINYGKTI